MYGLSEAARFSIKGGDRNSGIYVVVFNGRMFGEDYKCVLLLYVVFYMRVYSGGLVGLISFLLFHNSVRV